MRFINNYFQFIFKHDNHFIIKFSTNYWELCKLGELTTRITRKNKTLESTLPLTISAQNGLVDQRTFFNKKVASHDVSGYYLLKNGDFAYNKSYSKGYPWGTIKRLDKYDMGVLSTLYIVFKPINVNSDFLASYYDSSYWYREVSMNAAEGARNHGLLNISASDFFNTELSVPSNNLEQIKISDFLLKINMLVDLQQDQLSRFISLRKSILQRTIPNKEEEVPKIRFTYFNDNWKQYKLENISNIIGGGTPSTSNPKYWNGNIDWYSPAEIGNDIYVHGSIKRITSLGLSKSSAHMLPVGTILFTSRAGIGNTAILGKEAATNQGFQSIVPNKNELDSYFIFARTSELKKYGETNGAGSTFIEVSGKQMSRMPILIPSIKEQKKIGNLISTLDNLINLYKTKIEKLKSLKKILPPKTF